MQLVKPQVSSPDTQHKISRPPIKTIAHEKLE